MGIDCRLLLHQNITLCDLISYLETKYDILSCITKNDEYNGFLYLYKGEEKYNIFVYVYPENDTNQPYLPIKIIPHKTILLSMRSNLNNINILIDIANQFGGYLNCQDCDNNWELINQNNLHHDNDDRYQMILNFINENWYYNKISFYDAHKLALFMTNKFDKLKELFNK